MLFSYADCIKKYGNKSNLDKALENGDIYKIEKGVYSDKKNISELSIISYKNPKAVFAKDSAYFYHGLTDYVPDKYYLATNKDAYKIKDKRVSQVFCTNKQFDFGIIEIEYEGTKIKIFNKERMLVELARNKKKMPFDYYKEIVNNFRSIQNDLNIKDVTNYAKKYANTDNIVKTLQEEVF